MLNKSSHRTIQNSIQKSRRQIYIASLGKGNNKQICCHIYQDNQKLRYEKRKLSLFHTLNLILSKSKRQAFSKIIRVTHTKRKRIPTVFLPQEILNDNRKIINEYKQRLNSSVIDRYIPLHLGKQTKLSKNKSQKFEKTEEYYTNRYNIHTNYQNKDYNKSYQSTGIQNYRNTAQSLTSRSIDISKIKNHSNKNIIIFDINQCSTVRKKSLNKSNILNISYTQLTKDQINRKSIRNLNQGSSTAKIKYYSNENNQKQGNNKRSIKNHVKITQFNIEAFEQKSKAQSLNIKEIGNEQHNMTKQASTKNQGSSFARSIQVQNLLTSSPYIGKNRIRSSKITHLTYSNHSSDNKFQNIQLNI